MNELRKRNRRREYFSFLLLLLALFLALVLIVRGSANCLRLSFLCWFVVELGFYDKKGIISHFVNGNMLVFLFFFFLGANTDIYLSLA